MRTWPDKNDRAIGRFLRERRLRHPQTPMTYRHVLRGFQDVVKRCERSSSRVSRRTLEVWLHVRGAVWSASTVLHRACIVDRFLDFLVREGSIASNPVAELRTKYCAMGSETILRALLAPEPDQALEALRQLPRFGSVLGDLMRNHIALMRTRGFRYDTETRMFLRFDRFLHRHSELAKEPVPVMLQHWAAARSTAFHAADCELLGRALARARRHLDPSVPVPRPDPCMLSEGGEKTQNRQGRGRSKTLEVKQPVGEQDRRATTKSAGNPDSRWGRKVEPELRKAGSRPKRKWVKVVSQYRELFVGIDVAKRTLEVALSSGESLTVDNDDASIARLVKDLVKRAPALVVLEATGGYERKVWLALLEAGIATARVNPRDTYHFAQAHRQLAKTDGLDARGLVLFAAQVGPQPDLAPGAEDERLREMVGRRQQLTTMLSAERNRHQQAISAANRRSIQSVIRFLERQRKALDQALEKHLKNHAQMRELNELLQTAKGVGAVVAATLIARLPELGTLSRGQIAALVGVAPYDRKSGDWDGRSHIFGGRLEVRCALYMAVLGAVRGDPHLRAFYRRLLEQGKEKKVALTACIRKLAIMLNAMVKNRTPWRPSCPTLA